MGPYTLTQPDVQRSRNGHNEGVKVPRNLPSSSLLTNSVTCLRVMKARSKLAEVRESHRYT